MTATEPIKKVRGTADIGLSFAGKEHLADDTGKLAEKGGFDVIFSSPLYRARKTAQAFLNASPVGAKMIINPGLLPQSQGSLEGKPNKGAIKRLLRDYEDKRPDDRLPGTSQYTGLPAETFNEAKNRFLSKGLIPAMKFSEENPDLKVLALGHSSNLKIAKGWDEAGRPQDLKIAPGAMKEETESPTAVLRMEKGKGFTDVDFNSPEKIQPGFHIGRHAATPWGG
jgi:broad specificity phosphatase PhoE